MLTRGNGKLGKIWNFSIPAHHTCPGETSACASVCYASKGWFKAKNVKNLYTANLDETKKSSFADKMVNEIARNSADLVRVHVAGDFYSADYISKWTEVARRCPDTKFFAYTRSWRLPALISPLEELAQMPNFYLWLSCDRDTHELHGRPPRIADSKIAFMQITTDEHVPPYSDLVFRVNRKGTVKFINGVFVCPHENGSPVKLNCTSCKQCWSDSIPRKPVESLSSTVYV